MSILIITHPRVDALMANDEGIYKKNAQVHSNIKYQLLSSDQNNQNP